MSQIDIVGLETSFRNWRQDRAPAEQESEAFEFYSIEQILKDADLSDEDISSGWFGGPDDGGVDAMYFFINRTLIAEETPVPQSAITAELVIIQAKYVKAFQESSIQKLLSFSMDLFDWAKPVKTLTYLSADVRESIERFRDNYDKIVASPHSLKITFHYATKTDYPPDPKVLSEVLPKNRTSGLNRKHTGNEWNKTKQANATKILWRVQSQGRLGGDQSSGNHQPDRHAARGASAPGHAVEATTLTSGSSRL